VAEINQTCAWRHGGQQARSQFVAGQRQRDRDLAVMCAALCADLLPGGIAGAIFQVCAQHFVARLQIQ